MAMKPVKVSQINSYIKRILQTDPLLGNVSIIGEVSNLKVHGSGHVYFTLKDENSKLNCFLAASNLQNMRYELSDGMEITASGYISVYERGGTYSLNIKDIEVSGMGNLTVAFEKLKEKLLSEGLFAQERKKAIPFFPEKIAIVTSETGAAVQDILKIIKTKNNYTDILIYPVLVQGPAAAGEIAGALDHINREFSDIDTIIVGRGGGSMEELWAFNEEVVARSIFASEIPVISAVGHEIDFTIADFAADIRAETPTAAAEMAVPSIEELKAYTQGIRELLKTSVSQVIQYKQVQLQGLNLSVFQRDLESRIALEQLNLAHIKEDNLTLIIRMLEAYENKLRLNKVTLDSMNPKALMKRGYAAVLHEDRTFVSHPERLQENETVTITFSEIEADCNITAVRRKS